MARSNANDLPKGSIDELVEFFDAHDMGAYWDESLVNSFLREKLAEAS